MRTEKQKSAQREANSRYRKKYGDEYFSIMRRALRQEEWLGVNMRPKPENLIEIS